MSSPVLDRWVTLPTRHRRRQLEFAERTAGWLPSWRTRRRRQVVVLAFLTAVTVSLVGALVAGGQGQILGWSVVFVAGVLVALGLQQLLRVLTSHVAELSRHVLDEREVQLRQLARSAGFVTTLWLGLAVLGYLVVIGAVARSDDDALHAVTRLLSLALFTGACTPTVVLAWVLPDEEVEG